MAVNCQNPDTLESLAPCLNCLSMGELLAVLVIMFANQNSIDPSVVAAGAAKFRNIGDLQFMRELISAMPTSWRSGMDFTDLGADFSNLTTYGEQELKAILLNQWCVYWNT